MYEWNFVIILKCVLYVLEMNESAANMIILLRYKYTKEKKIEKVRANIVCTVVLEYTIPILLKKILLIFFYFSYVISDQMIVQLLAVFKNTKNKK